MARERKNIFRALFRDPFQPFLRTQAGDRSYSYVFQSRNPQTTLRSRQNGIDCESLIKYVSSLWEASKETMKQIFWKSSIGNGNIVHYTFYQHFENPMLIRNRDLGTDISNRRLYVFNIFEI